MLAITHDGERIGWALAAAILWVTGTAALMRRAPVARPVQATVAGVSQVLVVHASQTGFATELAHRTADALRDAGLGVVTCAVGELDSAMLSAHTRALFVVSTTGEGDAPDSAVGFQRALMSSPRALSHLHYGILALGDRDYEDFCAFGRDLEHWLHASGATALFDRVDVDNGDDGALRHWQDQLRQLSGNAELPDWQRPAYGAWRVNARQLLNAGSQGLPCFHVSLVPDDLAALDWQAGDILEVGPKHGDAVLRRWTEQAGVAPDASLLAALASMHLPEPASVRGMPVAAWLPTLSALPHREYSIASVPADGSLDLVVRQQRGADGSSGLGSGWLTEHVSVGGRVDARVRRNPGFHAPSDDRPVILIGNGTGIAGLRALLKQRMARGHRRNWLLFGERQAAVDRLHVDELERWQHAGDIAQLDLVWSRDGGAGRYVQDALRANAPMLRTWVAEGASLYVCGSLAGMAPAVDSALRESLGDAMVDTLLEAGRYRRDVY
ncbi:sulfite reductase subunit alpha [Luteibacter sp. Sphag1AF]|uniref:sulfite reductase subunit alpha n=1 Tax=Luteibacter sp. Sphag1AF TaxID=2587031 RepID=UPI00161DE2C8|nr:sulfite reductase subunit alpha [Luteibacter sp. Sphag1AF]